MKRELYFEDGQEILSIEDWEKKGKPKMWFKMYDKGGIRIFKDKAYGAIKLITPCGEDHGKDMAIVENIVAFGPYYSGVIEIYTPYKPI